MSPARTFYSEELGKVTTEYKCEMCPSKGVGSWGPPHGWLTVEGDGDDEWYCCSYRHLALWALEQNAEEVKA